jgi:hypothetical protein
MCLFKPMEFFAAMPTSGGHGRPLVFAMILGFIGTVGAVVWQMLFSGLGMMISGGEGVGGPEVAIMGGVMIGFVIFSPLLIAIGLYIGAAVIHVLLMIFRGAGGGFEATFRVIAYTSSTQLFALVPILGGMVAGLYALVLLILGLPKAHNTDTWRAVVAVLVLPVGFVFLAIFAAILIPILISSGR